MRPYPEEILRTIQAGVMSHFAPELTSTYAKAQFGFSMLLFSVATRDYDSAVPDLLEAIATLRSLLEGTQKALADVTADGAEDARAVLAALPPAAGGLRLSALRTEHEALRAVISQLAPLIERAADDPELAALRPSRSVIYAYLSADARRRMVPILTAG